MTTVLFTWFLQRYVKAQCVLALQACCLQPTWGAAMRRRFGQTWAARWVWLEGQP